MKWSTFFILFVLIFDEPCSKSSPKIETKVSVDKLSPFHQNGFIRSEENIYPPQIYLYSSDLTQTMLVK